MNNHHKVYMDYKRQIDDVLLNSIDKTSPETLYGPLEYVLSGKGKRIRPILVLFCCEAYGGKMADALNASAAIEMLHNFTLVHDDIMDNAEMRRGRETVHKKWNNNIAILSGDHLIGLAYMYLLKTKSQRLNEVIKCFTEGVIEVCEGQSYDKEFERKENVSLEEYLMMISKKTAKMLETSAVVGAILGGAENKEAEGIRSFALNIGLAFQIQDDLLDINAEENELGKKIGGDLIEGKKTYLLLKAMEVVNDDHDKKKIEGIMLNNGLHHNDNKSITEIKKIYEKYGVLDAAQNDIRHYTNLADKFLDTLPAGEHKERLRWFSNMLLTRSF